jgi:SET and MYND domain-containing protein 4
MNCGKSDAKAEKLRAEANRHYVQKDFYDALLKYNESLCFAEAESENMGLAYANRSAVYIEMRLFDKCLRNIELAKLNHYPEKNLEILNKRASKCAEMAKQQKVESGQDDVWSCFQLSHPPNGKLPFIADCLELKSDMKYGRHIVTNRLLNVGDIIAIEEPAFKVIKADSRYSTCFESNAFQRCANCLHENLLSLIPCPSCCKTMYCSVDCMNAARRHHQYECEIVDELLTSGLMHIVLRMFFEGLSLFDGDIHEVERFLAGHDGSMTIFDLDCKSSNASAAEDGKRRFLATVSLARSDETMSLDDYENAFQKTDKLEKLWNSHEKFIRKLLSRLVTVGTLYVHGIGGWPLKHIQFDDDDPKNPSFFQQLIGNGCYLFCSLLNHSCAPNLKRLNVDDKVVIIVSRQIKQGGQLFDSYRPNFNNQFKAQRQEALLKDYGFVCDCEACINDWPMNENLQVFSEQLLEFAWEAHEELPFLTPDEARKKLKEYYATTERHQMNFPSAELIVLQECISNCLIAITKPAIQFP